MGNITLNEQLNRIDKLSHDIDILVNRREYLLKDLIDYNKFPESLGDFINKLTIELRNLTIVLQQNKNIDADKIKDLNKKIILIETNLIYSKLKSTRNHEAHIYEDIENLINDIKILYGINNNGIMSFGNSRRRSKRRSRRRSKRRSRRRSKRRSKRRLKIT